MGLEEDFAGFLYVCVRVFVCVQMNVYVGAWARRLEGHLHTVSQAASTLLLVSLSLTGLELTP